MICAWRFNVRPQVKSSSVVAVVIFDSKALMASRHQLPAPRPRRGRAAGRHHRRGATTVASTGGGAQTSPPQIETIFERF